jgi:putative transposase
VSSTHERIVGNRINDLILQQKDSESLENHTGNQSLFYHNHHRSVAECFFSIPLFDMMINSLKSCQTNKGLHLHGYVLMPNHAHYIVSTDLPEKLSDIMRDLNRFTSHRIADALEENQQHALFNVFRQAAKEEGRGNQYKIWQEGYHPIALETADLFQQKLEYIHENPVRKGFVDRAEQWRYSSARNYLLNDHSIIEVKCIE